MKKIIFTGGSGRFGKVFKKNKYNLKTFYPNKKELNILNLKSIENYIKRKKPNYFIHCAGLSRPMDVHEKDITKSINLNIIGTCNVVFACDKFNLKLIYFSTGYVYPGIKGNYKENDSVLPINNYAWSKLGGECAVKLYKNSLILRITMCERPFPHKYAFDDVKANFMFNDEVAKIIPKILNKKGVLNIGGKTQSIYRFAKRNKKNVKKSSSKSKLPKNLSMNLSKLNKIIKF
tara:strand:+ start:1103 stop:1801 length:699 start_codon:yes stop_codon:yes gene_type:complete